MIATWKNQCAARKTYGHLIPHEPAELDAALRDGSHPTALDSRHVEGGVVLVNLCKHCGCTYLELVT